MTTPSIAALVYQPGAGIDDIMRDIAAHLRGRGWRLAGFVQLNEPRQLGARCNMTLQELSSGERLAISENRGREARGCMLDVAELVRGVAIASAALADRPDLLMVNKFGKTEAAGRGFLPVIVEAIESGVPVLIAVPAANLHAWLAFAGDYSVMLHLAELPSDAAALSARLGFGKKISALALSAQAS